MDNTGLKDSGEKAQLVRLLYMLLYGFVLYLTMSVLAIVVIVQFVFALFSGSSNESIRGFSKDLARFIQQIVLFLTYNDERKPFPFTPLYDEVEVEAVYDNDDYIADYEDITDSDDPAAPKK
ncbi:DUF4389 domain-containing protein [Methylophaga nitratireducenticrescens]|uniref:Lipase n=1 Tax=Methylophaga nitratireducenticrescens TaxID=754476 RepID=I1XMI0_METNJ|nr:DUF4389 domain-containing protein [Methylophaga nitratireducenticrescens]AFI85599.1 lipase [Methylophaga nitratireducenticrescens]AUZ85332.1 lipase [Methylophaga nitratireducenticrescens]